MEHLTARSAAMPTRPTRRTAPALVSSGLSAALALVGCTAAPADPPRPRFPATVTVGLLAAAGDGASGTDATRGAELAVEVINEAHPELELPLAAAAGLPSLGQARLELAVADTGGQPEDAVDAMGRLLAQPRLVGVVAADRAEVLVTAGAYADREQVPMVDSATTADFLLDIGLDWYFRTGPPDRALAGAILALLGPEAGSGRLRVTVVTPDNRRAAAAAGALGEQALAAGFETTESVTIGADLGARLGLAAPDVVIALAPEPGDGADLHQALASWTAPPTSVLAGLGPGFSLPGIGQDAPEAMRSGMLHAAAWSAELAGRQPLAQAVAALYQQRYGSPMTAAGAGAFTALMVLATAVDAAGRTRPAEVRAALRQLSIPATQIIMPWPGIRFGEFGQNELAAAVVEQSGEDGLRLVYPPEVAVTELAWRS
jgi:branched-chain amino acid transport system substrate-binding protein